MTTPIQFKETLLVCGVAQKIHAVLIHKTWSGVKGNMRKLFYHFGEMLQHIKSFGMNKKNELKFYTEFPSGIVSPVFHQLSFNKYLVMEGIKDKRTIKKMRALNLLILVHSDSNKKLQK